MQTYPGFQNSYHAIIDRIDTVFILMLTRVSDYPFIRWNLSQTYTNLTPGSGSGTFPQPLSDIFCVWEETSRRFCSSLKITRFRKERLNITEQWSEWHWKLKPSCMYTNTQCQFKCKERANSIEVFKSKLRVEIDSKLTFTKLHKSEFLLGNCCAQPEIKMMNHMFFA